MLTPVKFYDLLFAGPLLTMFTFVINRKEKIVPFFFILLFPLTVLASDLYTVARTVDGDTLKLNNSEKVRLIGIDTPEASYNPKLYRDARRTGQDVQTIRALGKRATLFTKQLVEGKRVRLEFDVQPRDRYGRLLAYVYLEDGTFVNAEIIKQGYAQVMTVPPNVRYQDLFLKLQREARENRKGLWS